MPSLREAQERYARYYLALAEQAEPHLTGAEQVAWLDRLELELPNLRATLDWAQAVGAHGCVPEVGLRVAGAVWPFWATRGYLSEGRSWLEGLLRRGRVPETSGGGAALRAKVLKGAGNLAYLQGDYARARVLHEESLALYRELGERRGIASSLGNLGSVAQEQGDNARATALYEESLALFRALGDKRGIAYGLEGMARVATAPGATPEVLERAARRRRCARPSARPCHRTSAPPMTARWRPCAQPWVRPPGLRRGRRGRRSPWSRPSRWHWESRRRPEVRWRCRAARR